MNLFEDVLEEAAKEMAERELRQLTAQFTAAALSGIMARDDLEGTQADVAEWAVRLGRLTARAFLDGAKP